MSSQGKSRVLIMNDDCDVVSLQEEGVEEATIKETYRRDQLKRFFAQCYMQSAWQDFEFINGLKTDKILSQSTQNADSFASINKEIDDCTQQIGKFTVNVFNLTRTSFHATQICTFTNPRHVFVFSSLNCMVVVHCTLIAVGCTRRQRNERTRAESPSFESNIRRDVTCLRL